MTARPIRNTGAILFVIAFSSLLATFNETFLNVALTPIMSDFSVDANTVQWVATAYMLCAAIMVPVTGFLYKRVPTKRLMAVALCFLLLGSVLGVFAPSFPALLVARVVQALGTGMLVPLGMNLTLVVAPEGRLGTYMGTVSAMTTLGPALGPIVAGAVLEAYSWHALFGLFALLVAICLVLTVALIPNVSNLSNARIDVASICLISVALIGLLYGISTIFSGQLVAAVVSIVIGAGCLAVFVSRQSKIADPLLDLRPFKNPLFVIGLLLVIIALMTVFSMNMILPVFMQGALGYTALDAALALFPACIASCVLSPIAGRVYDRKGLRVITPVGLACVALFTFVLSTIGGQARSWQIVVFYLFVILGVSLTMGPAQSFALSRLERDLYPHGVSIVSISFQIAGCLGSSVFMGIFSLVQNEVLRADTAPTEAIASGFSSACLLATALGVVGFVLSIVLSRQEKASKGMVSAESVEPANELESGLQAAC